MNYSRYQQDIFTFIQSTSANAIVEAVAGSGKSFTLEHSIRHILDAKPDARIIALVFNKHNATSLENKLSKYGVNVSVKTIHSLGMSMLTASYGRMTVKNDKYASLVKKWIGNDWNWSVIPFIVKLIHFIQVNVLLNITSETLWGLIDQYNLYSDALDEIEMPDIVRCIKDVLNDGINQTTRGIISFDDMLFAPVVLKLKPSFKVDYIFIDEAQDLSVAQLEVALKPATSSSRVFAFGDTHQAIQMFAGAMSNSMQVIQQRIGGTELPLSICYRCPSKHLDLARKLVPHIEAREDAPEGIILEKSMTDAIDLLVADDLVICKHNAPVIRMAIKAIKSGVRGVKVRGKDIGAELTSHFKKIKKQYGTVDHQAIDSYTDVHRLQLANKNASEKAIELFLDAMSCLHAILDGYEDIESGIEHLFADTGSAIWFSSVHKAKGLEANTVYIVEPELLDKDYPGSNPEQVQQRKNLKYVALTRAKNMLVFIK